MAKSKTPWVVAGGKIGEMGHCEHCGRGLEAGGPQPLPIALAMMNAFVKMHANCKPGQFHEPETNAPEAWLEGRDTGISSCTIYAVMMNQKAARGHYDVPHDPADFGRCYRLLKLFPTWRQRLPEVAQRFPAWGALIREWNNLTLIYEAGLVREDGGKMYRLMQQLRDEGASSEVQRDQDGRLTKLLCAEARAPGKIP